MKLLFVILLFISSAFAGDSGSYFNIMENGQGLMLQRNGDTVFFVFFTYGADSNCGEPQPSPSVTSCNKDGQRWFFAANEWDNIDQSVRGFLFITDGLDFPLGIDGNVGSEEVVGRYILARQGDGYFLSVSRFNNRLEIEDPLYDGVIDLTDLVIRATD